ncbi:MAG TPA: cytochrome c biogenesis protein CcdA [Thermoanaerobaculia bacterium]|jgi:thiol:disulfide interchange protein DsbD|nr:cytochrome c biogenesis protein CcdA [Thermoanaerobaculia bacterium]
MNRLASAVLAFLFIAPVSFAQIGGFAGGDGLPKATIEGALHQRTGDEVQGTINATIADGWHVNSHTPTEEFSIPTVLELDPATAELIGEVGYPQHAMKAFAFTGGKELAVYDGKFAISFRAKLKPGATKIGAILRYQACSDSVCLPPNRATVDIDVSKLTAATAAPTPTSGAFTPLSAAPKDALPKDKLSQTFASRGLPLTLVLLFIGGLALNLTPCVFPLIPITLGFFGMQSDGRRSRRFALSAMYVLGIVITYSTLGVLAALGGKLFGAWLQLPAVLVGFALLMLILASSMFGVFDIQPPKWITNRSQGRAGLAGALTMGLLIGIVAAPCVGPVVISLITLVAQLGDPVLGGVMFATLAFGLGFPYLVLLNALPRPGEWMVTVKKGMGFVLVALAFYFVRPLIGDEVFRYGVAASLLIGAVFLLASRAKGARALRLTVGILLLVAGVAFAIPKKELPGVKWEKYDAKTLADARAAGKPVVIDFYADWCMPCKELDEKTFTDERVIKELDRYVRVKADLTVAEDATTQALTKQYTILGVPTIVFLDATGNEVAGARLTGFEPADAFLKRAQSVK